MQDLESKEKAALTQQAYRYAQELGVVSIPEKYTYGQIARSWSQWQKEVDEALITDQRKIEARIQHNANQLKLADEDYNHFGTSAEQYLKLAREMEASRKEDHQAVLELRSQLNEKYSLTYCYGLQELNKWYSDTKKISELKSQPKKTTVALSLQVDKKGEEYIKGMITRVEEDENDLEYEEFTEINCRAILGLAEKNPELCNKPAFKKLLVIASILMNYKIDILDDGVLQAVIWFIRNSKGLQKFEIHNLENKEYFSWLLKEMKEAGALSSVLFEMMKIPVEAITEYLHEMSGVKGLFYSQDNTFSLRPHDYLSVNAYTFYESAFRLDTLRQCVEATKNSVQLHVCRHVFSLHEVEYLISLATEKLSSLTFDNACEFSPEAKACLFEKGQGLFKCMSPSQGLHKEYEEYCRDAEEFKRVKALVERYKNDAVSYSELFDGETRKFIIKFNGGDRASSLSDEERKALADLFDIVIFDNVTHRIREIDVSSDQTFRVMRWMLSHANKALPTLKVYKVQDVCALIAAHAQNSQRSHATIVVPASGENLTINCNPEGAVRLSMTGVPQNAEMFNQMVNSIEGRVRLEFFKDQFLLNMDLSSSSIECIDFADRESRFVISDEHVQAFKQAKNLKYFRAVNCDFNSPQTKEAFIDAILANESLRELVLSDCGLTKKHIEKITAYAKTHPSLIKVVLSSNAFREGEANELLEIVRENEARFDEMETHKRKCNWFIQEVRKVGKSFQENKKILKQSVRIFKDFYKDHACVAAYVEALQEYLKKWSFSSYECVDSCIVERLNKFFSYCTMLSDKDRLKVLNVVVEVLEEKGLLFDVVLGELFRDNYSNDRLIQLQRQRFDTFEREFLAAIKDNNFPKSNAILKQMKFLVFKHSQNILFQKLYDAYLQLANLYSARDCETDKSDSVLHYLASIPVTEERLYQLAQESFRAVFCKKIREILLF
ncbi:MAG: hypothetical protein SFW07_08325, partial [Gammaproteobacteria bacterium]|nr:hypothetical protein [Gammaproteobacteria bacterium]